MITTNGLGNELGVEQNPAVIDALIKVIELPFALRQREAFQDFANCSFRPDVLHAVVLEGLPTFRVMLRKVSRSAAVGLCGLAGDGEEFDQPLA